MARYSSKLDKTLIERVNSIVQNPGSNVTAKLYDNIHMAKLGGSPAENVLKLSQGKTASRYLFHGPH